jgi:uncharacterized membrane protein
LTFALHLVTKSFNKIIAMKRRIPFGWTLAIVLSSASLTLADSYNYTTIDFPGASQTVIGGINNSGQLVGGYQLADQSRHGFLDVGGVFTTIDDPNATSGSEATGINNSGQIVGTYNLNPPEVGHVLEGAHGFLYNQAAMTFSPIDDPTAGVTNTTPIKINDAGDIVGIFRVNGGSGNGFLDSGGSFSTVNFPGQNGTHDNGINNGGEIVGQYKDSGGARHGFLDNGGIFTTIDFPGAPQTILSDINNFGDILGNYTTTQGAIFGFVDKAGTLTTIAFPGAVNTEAYGINDKGDIVGTYEDDGGVFHGFEAAAVPEPGTFGLLGAGISLIMLRLQYRRVRQ